MPRKYWNVVTSGESWAVREEGGGLLGQFGTTYRTQAEALQEARRLAHQHHTRTGSPTGVRLQGADSRWRQEFTYGNDPFPPRG